MEKELFNVVAEPLEEVRQAFQDTRHSWHSIEDVRVREMLQSLLEGRFQLKYRRQTRVGTAYFLERTREPLKL